MKDKNKLVEKIQKLFASSLVVCGSCKSRFVVPKSKKISGKCAACGAKLSLVQTINLELVNKPNTKEDFSDVVQRTIKGQNLNYDMGKAAALALRAFLR